VRAVADKLVAPSATADAPVCDVTRVMHDTMVSRGVMGDAA
jgi:hypothetical protein